MPQQLIYLVDRFLYRSFSLCLKRNRTADHGAACVQHCTIRVSHLDRFDYLKSAHNLLFIITKKIQPTTAFYLPCDVFSILFLSFLIHEFYNWMKLIAHLFFTLLMLMPLQRFTDASAMHFFQWFFLIIIYWLIKRHRLEEGCLRISSYSFTIFAGHFCRLDSFERTFRHSQDFYFTFGENGVSVLLEVCYTIVFVNHLLSVYENWKVHIRTKSSCTLAHHLWIVA